MLRIRSEVRLIAIRADESARTSFRWCARGLLREARSEHVRVGARGGARLARQQQIRFIPAEALVQLHHPRPMSQPHPPAQPQSGSAEPAPPVPNENLIRLGKAHLPSTHPARLCPACTPVLSSVQLTLTTVRADAQAWRRWIARRVLDRCATSSRACSQPANSKSLSSATRLSSTKVSQPYTAQSRVRKLIDAHAPHLYRH